IITAKVVHRFAKQGNVVLSYLTHYILDISLHVSLLTIVCMTIEKFLAVKKPYMMRNLSKKFRVAICLVIWLMTIGLIFVFEYNVSLEDEHFF
ncbi:7 transmembrane receptor, partial [Acinetobacter baumannii]|uniref:7 transmembrane receptor n=1 Tax=Acinetobacter baumannii TaxID=470 RepID=UPI001C06FB09